MQKQAKVLIIDSGAGGLTVAKEIFNLHPHLSLSCFSDTARYPYGKIEEENLIARLLKIVKHFNQVLNPDICVIACNTASTVALTTLRANFNIPFIGVVPAIKPAAKLSSTGAIGVLATPATVKRPYTHQLVNDFASETQVHMHGSQALVAAAEDFIESREVSQALLKHELEALLEKSATPIDTIVLACTHFPLLKPHFESISEYKSIQWVDSGNAIANRVTYWLNELEQFQASDSPGKVEVRFSSSDKRLAVYKKFISSYFPKQPDTLITTHIDSI